MRDIDKIRHALSAASARGERLVLATVMSVEGSVYRGAGARMIVHADGTTIGAVSGGCLEADVVARAPEVLAGGPELIHYDTRSSDDVLLGLGMGCQGIIELLLEPLSGPALANAAAFYARIAARRDEVTLLTLVRSVEGSAIGSRLLVDANGQPILGDVALLERHGDVAREDIAPAINLLICGGGTDAIPLAALAKSMGWRVTVVDHRSAFASADRFGTADSVACVNLTHGDESLANHVQIDEHSMGVVMAHSATHDRAYLHALLDAGAAYIGVLGPRRRTLELLGDANPVDDKDVPASVHSPAGLDLGAETPEEIALSIVAEIAAVSRGRAGGLLRERRGPIHDRRPKHSV
jgi:Xanthine and CO dehydrogenases maturation factor, XdhC/CoxF family